jgi:hypothetical protein
MASSFAALIVLPASADENRLEGSGSCCDAPAARSRRFRRALGGDPIEQRARRLVVRVLWDELAAERLRED